MTTQHPSGPVRTGISAEPLSVDRVLAEVAHERAGAVVTFVGLVRDHDGGRDGVVDLDYTAHPSADAVLGEVAGAVASRPGVHRVLALHRSGRLAVGDTAVVCAVSAEHRAEAFAACRELIEELKASVPIWKQQRFADGADEWVGL